MSDDDPATADTAPSGAICYRLDGRGGAEAVAPGDFAALSFPPGDPGFGWQHLRRDDPQAKPLLAALGLQGLVVDALAADETRPRCTLHEDGALLNLRGVNLQPGAEPEDMVSVRLWLTGHRVVGLSRRPLHAIDDIHASLRRGHAPVSPGDFVAKLALRLADRAEPAVGELGDEIDAIEEAALGVETGGLRMRLSETRRRAIMLRRYLVPQREALTTLEIEDFPWLGAADRARLREAADRVLLLGEELDAIRDRAQVVQDHLIDQRAESLNRRMLLLAIVTAVFLPLSLVTGLMGINVGGIPGADSPFGFWAVCAVLAGVGGGAFALFRWLGLFR